MEGNKNNIKIVIPLNIPLIPMGEFTILAELVVAVMESKIPALTEAIKPAIRNKMAAKI